MKKFVASPSSKKAVKASLNNYYSHPTDQFTAFNDLVDTLGKETVVKDLIAFLDFDTVESFIDNEVDLYNLDDPEYGTYPYNNRVTSSSSSDDELNMLL